MFGARQSHSKDQYQHQEPLTRTISVVSAPLRTPTTPRSPNEGVLKTSDPTLVRPEGRQKIEVKRTREAKDDRPLRI